MGSSGGSQGSTTSTTTQELPDYIKPAAGRFLERGEALSQVPYSTYPGQRISGLNSVHNYALDQGRSHLGGTLPGAQQTMSNFAQGSYNSPAYIHPWVGPSGPAFGMSRPYGKGGAPAPGQPGPQVPGPGEPSGTPIAPTAPNVPGVTPLPSPGGPGPAAPQQTPVMSQQQVNDHFEGSLSPPTGAYQGGMIPGGPFGALLEVGSAILGGPAGLAGGQYTPEPMFAPGTDHGEAATGAIGGFDDPAFEGDSLGDFGSDFDGW